jgi:hypothetical protein
LKKNYTTNFDHELGCQVYRFEQVINCQARPVEKTADKPKESKAPDGAIDNATKDESTEVSTDNTEADSKPENDTSTDTTDTEITAENSAEITGDGLTRQRWRLISAVQAWPSSGFWLPQLVDYGVDGGRVLKEAVSAVNNGRPDLLWNHSSDAHDVAGYVENATWEDSTDIVPGVNGDLVVDPAFDAKAAMGLEKGLIRSGSIGVTMDCRPSHPDMEFEDFVEHQGEDIDGEKVRWIPTRLHDVRHMALIPSGTGADPNAGRRDHQNNTNNPKEVKTEIPQGGNGNMKEMVALLSDLSQKLGVEVALSEDASLPEGLKERLNKKVIKLMAVSEKYNVLCSKVEDLGEGVSDGVTPLSHDELFDAIKARLELAKHGEKLLTHYRADALKWFDAAKAALGTAEQTDADKRIRGRLAKADDLDLLEDAAIEYRTIAEAEFSAKRTSEGNEIPTGSAAPEPINPDILASASKLF